MPSILVPAFLLAALLVSCGDDNSSVSSYEQTSEMSSSSVNDDSSSSIGTSGSSAKNDKSSSSVKVKDSSSSRKIEVSSNSSKKGDTSSSMSSSNSSSSTKYKESSSSAKKKESSSSKIPDESSSSKENTSSSQEDSSSSMASSSSSKKVESSSSKEKSSSSQEDSSSSSVKSSSSSATIPSKLYDCEKYKCVTTKHLNPDIDYGEYLDVRDSQVYRTVLIGEQMWMAQNLNYNIDSSFCYANDSLNCLSNGRMYSWLIANQICPNGWHLPDTADFNRLVDFVRLNNGGKDVAPNLMSGKNDIFGFSSITSGGYGTGAKFSGFDKQYYWTSTALEDDPNTIEDESKKAWVRYLYSSGKYLSYERFNQKWLLSIRCIKE